MEEYINMAYEQSMNQTQWQPQQTPLQTYIYENIPETNIQNWAIAPGSRIVFLNQNDGKIIVKSFPYGSQQVTIQTYIDQSAIVPNQLDHMSADIPQNFIDDINWLKKEVRRLNNLMNKNKPKES